MFCPYCGFDENCVLESRDTEDGKVTRRRRECSGCKKRFTTYERVGNIDLKVVKKDGRIENFDPEKVLRGIRKACWKRPVSEEKIQKVADEVEMSLLNWESTEIPSKEVGKLLLKKLKVLDEVAYLRFASVYLDIKGIDDFKKIIKKMEEK